MSQALLTCMLPNGTQVLIPTLSSKNVELFPLVLLGDSVTGQSDDNAVTARIISSGVQVASSDSHPVMAATHSPNGTEDVQDDLGPSLENAAASSLRFAKESEKETRFENPLTVNSNLHEIVDVQRTRNGPFARNCGNSEVLFRTRRDVKHCEDVIQGTPVQTGHHSSIYKAGVTAPNNVTGKKYDINSVEEQISFPNIVQKYRTVEITVNGPKTNSESLELDSLRTDGGDVHSTNEEKYVVTLGKMLDAKQEDSEKFKNCVNTPYCVEMKDGNMTEEQTQLLKCVKSDSSSILKQPCHSVGLCLNNINRFNSDQCRYERGLISHAEVKHHVSHSESAVSEKLVFLCGQCSAGFSSIEACKTHMMQIHELIVHESEELSSNVFLKEDHAGPSNVGRRVCISNISATDSCNQKHPSGTPPFKCSVRGCQSKFIDEKNVQIHISCHAGSVHSRDFRCCECQAPFERWRSCAMHLWKVHNIDCGLLTCPICLKYKTATSVPLENHMRIHGEVRSFMCPECGKGFKQAAQLHNHRVMHLDRKTSELPRWYASKQCNICFKNYANSKCLKKHIQAVHSKLRPYVCQVCGHASARKAMLQLHYRQHTGEKPHSCPICDYKTGDHNSLRRHIMRHTGQRPYRCPHCPYSAIQSNSYKNHLRNKHPGQSGVFSCGQCSFKTVSHEGYLLHVSDHKNGVICNSPDGGADDVEVFPGNVAAAQLIYRCLNALSPDGSTVEANVTGSSTSADGTTQTITIQIPNQECTGENEDEVTQCFLEVQQMEEENVDTSIINVCAVLEQNSLFHVT